MTTTGRGSTVHLEKVEAAGSTLTQPSILTPTAARALAVLRASTGFVFLWHRLGRRAVHARPARRRPGPRARHRPAPAYSCRP